MKYLITDALGIYNKDGNKLVYDSNMSIQDLLYNYGFEFSELVNKSILDGKQLLSASDGHTTIKYLNNEGFILIKYDFSHYKNLKFDEAYMVAASSDGVNWKTKIGIGYMTGVFNVNLTTTDMLKMTSSEIANYTNLKKFINNNAKFLDEISNEDGYIKYLMLKLNSDELQNIKTVVRFTAGDLIKDETLDIEYSKDKVTIRNNKAGTIFTLDVKVNQTAYIKNTMEEFK